MKTRLAPIRYRNHPARSGAFPLDTYDRALQLSQLEKEVVRLWSAQPNRRAHPKKKHPDLVRLIQPLQAALTCYGVELTTQSTVCTIIIHEMHRRQTTFWAWGSPEWLELLGRTASDFQKRHGANSGSGRYGLLLCAYLFYDASLIEHITHYQQVAFACRVFGTDSIKLAIDTVADELKRLGLGPTLIRASMPGLVCEALLLCRSSRLADISVVVLEALRHKPITVTAVKRANEPVARALHNLGIIPRPLKHQPTGPKIKVGINDTVPVEWYSWIQRWHDTATTILSTRNGIRGRLAKVGRWLAENHPDITSPAQWTRDTCLAYAAAVSSMKVGQWIHPDYRLPEGKLGKPMAAHAKANLFATVRTFFLDCQEWQWIPAAFDPGRSLSCPSSIKRLRGPKPRVIADDIWAKLLSAGLTLTIDDLPGENEYLFNNNHIINKKSFYPLEMIRTIVLVWLFAGLRSNEIQRLRVGCARWQAVDTAEGLESIPKRSVCLLTVPISKTSDEFVKPVDYLIGEAIHTWEKLRPDTVTQYDPKTAEAVNFLFEWRGKRVSKNYVNQTIIPMLCRKAGVPESDAKGNITSHRARSTIATQLFNAREPMNLFELQEWLGHRSPLSTQYYAKINPTKLAKAYTDAGYFSRNVRIIDVLFDQEAIRSGAAANGEAYMFYDIAHGYCTYDFFDQCAHRMACAKCSFYQPKESAFVQMLEAKENLLRLEQKMPLSDTELQAVKEGIDTYEKLTAHLAPQLQDTPTPQGPTPRELQG